VLVQSKRSVQEGSQKGCNGGALTGDGGTEAEKASVRLNVRGRDTYNLGRSLETKKGGNLQEKGNSLHVVCRLKTTNRRGEGIRGSQ